MPMADSRPAPREGATNVVWHETRIDREQRAAQKRQRPCIVWMTGLSGSGKSTLANALEVRLVELGYHTYLLDGDNVRHGLNKDLGFSDADRQENIRRIAEVAKLFVDAGLIVTTAFISPFRAERELARSLVEDGQFVEVFVDAPLAVCEQRDPKGLYKKARAGEIPSFTGIDSPYEPPSSPELHVHTDQHTVPELVEQVVDWMRARGILS